MVVEDRVAALAEQLRTLGDLPRADRLAGVLAGPVAQDGHLPALREALEDVVASGLPDPLRAQAARVLAALADLPAALGVRGAVWAGWRGVGYTPVWLGPAGALEHGPADVDLSTAVAWGRRRARVVLVRPEWSPGTYYSVGVEHDPRHPRLELP